MKIKKVKYPIPSSKNCRGSYDHRTKTILVKKYSRYQHITIIHEFGHYIIDLIGLMPPIKHYLNLIYDVLWTIFDFKYTWKARKENIKWYLKYYRKDKWCY